VMDLISPPPIRPGETRLTISGETVPLKMWSTDLLSYIKTNGTLNVQQAAKFVYKVAAGLDHLHGLDCIHRDLKLEQILVGDAAFERVVVADYGQARSTEEFEETDSDSDSGEEPVLRTLTIQGFGSKGYQAPEIVNKSGVYGQPADMWSLGVMLHLVLTGASPFGLGPKVMEKYTEDNPCQIPGCPWQKRGVEHAKQDHVLSATYCPLTPQYHPKWQYVPLWHKDIIVGLLKVNTKARFAARDIIANVFVQREAGVVEEATMETLLSGDLETVASEAAEDDTLVSPNRSYPEEEV